MSYGGTTDSFGYDNDGLLTAAGRCTITRNTASGLPELVSAGSFQMNRSFNGYGEVEGAETSLSGSSAFSYDLTRNNGGRINAKREQMSGISSKLAYTYDNVGRLLSVTKDGSLVEEYRYDGNGNRTYEMNDFRAITGRTFTHSDEDHTLTAGPISYEFDYDDNLTGRKEGTEITQYHYSSTGELQRVTLPDNTLIEYSNDPLGRRIVKKVNGTIEEKYLWLNQTTLLAVYDGSGNSVKRVDYDSFGNIISDGNPSFAIPFGFAGGLHDRDTKLVRFGYRDYLPEIGKWTAKDPILFAGGDSNLYGYVQNDPVNWFDPLGLAWLQHRPLDSSGLRDTTSWRLKHTRFKYDDGTDSGYYSDGRVRSDNAPFEMTQKYRNEGQYLQDDILRKAEANLRSKWNTGNPDDYGLNNHNCQDYHEAVLNEYNRVKSWQ